MGEIMPNLLLGLFFIILNLSLLLVAYKAFGKTGLFIWIAIATIIANIQVNKTIEVIGLTATLGNTIYGSIFLATDILNEKYGPKSAKQSVIFGFASAAFLVLTMLLSLAFIPASTDYAQSALETIFAPSWRVVSGSLIAFLIAQFLDIKLYNLIKTRLPSDKYLWLRNNVATIVSQLVDSIIFVLIAFIFIYESNILFEIIITTLLFKVIVAILDTPFLYIAKKIKPVKDNF
jgi:queuosine precursor transporter